MNTNEHLWTILAEECSEIVQAAARCAQAVSKLLRFGAGSINPTGSSHYSNITDIVREVNDLNAMMELLKEEGVDVGRYMNRDDIDAKKRKVRAYMKHSKHLGLLQHDTAE